MIFNDTTEQEKAAEKVIVCIIGTFSVKRTLPASVYPKGSTQSENHNKYSAGDGLRNCLIYFIFGTFIIFGIFFFFSKFTYNFSHLVFRLFFSFLNFYLDLVFKVITHRIFMYFRFVRNKSVTKLHCFGAKKLY